MTSPSGRRPGRPAPSSRPPTSDERDAGRSIATTIPIAPYAMSPVLSRRSPSRRSSGGSIGAALWRGARARSWPLSLPDGQAATTVSPTSGSRHAHPRHRLGGVLGERCRRLHEQLGRGPAPSRAASTCPSGWASPRRGRRSRSDSAAAPGRCAGRGRASAPSPTPGSSARSRSPVRAASTSRRTGRCRRRSTRTASRA